MAKDKIFKLATPILILSGGDDDSGAGTVKPEKQNTHHIYLVSILNK
jgi:hypothetical protein